MLSKNPLKSLHDFILRILAFLEKDRFNVLTGFLFFIAVILVRGFFEVTFFTKNPLTGTILAGSFYNFYHVFAFYVCVLLFGILIMSFFSKQKPKNIANMVLVCFPVVIIAPFLDLLIFGRAEVYPYPEPGNYLENLLSLFTSSNAPRGLLMQLLGIISSASFYVFIKSLNLNNHKSRKQRITAASIRAILTGFSLYYVIGLFATLPVLVYHSLFNTGLFLYDPKFSTSLSLQLVDFIWLFLFGILLVIACVYVSNPKIVTVLRKKIRFSYIAYFILLGFIGIFVAGDLNFRLDGNRGLIYANDAPYGLVTFLTLAFGAQFTIMLRDVWNKKKESAVLSSSQYLNTVILIALIAFLLSVLLGYASMLLTLACIGLAYAYNVPALRVRKNILARSTIFGIGSSLAYLIGYFTTNQIITPTVWGYIFGVPITTAIPDSKAILIGLVIFVFGFMVSLIVFKLRKSEIKTRGS